jgi:hypothetical protein
MSTDTSGFYRLNGDGEFQHAPNFVHGPGYSLLRADHATYTYPTQGGWIWFDDLVAAQSNFEVTILPNKGTAPEPIVPPLPISIRK